MKQISYTPLEKTINHFAGCGRCSFFLAGYRVLEGEEGIETAVSQQEAEWLPLTWSFGMRDLVARSYGIRLDVELIQLEGSCPECARAFAYQQIENEESGDTDVQFKIQFSLA